MLSLLLVITLQIFHLNLALDQNNKLFKTSEKRSDSHLRRSFDPGYAWGNNNNLGAGVGGGGPRFRMRNPSRSDFRSFNRRKLFRDRFESRQGGGNITINRTVLIPLENVTNDDCICGHEIGTPEHRPWIVKITPGAMSNSECDGAILNRKFILTTASCFCIRENRGSLDCNFIDPSLEEQKRIQREDWEFLDRVSVQLGPDNQAIQTGSPFVNNLVKVLILHSRYRFNRDNHMPIKDDIALLEMTSDLYTGDGIRWNGQMIVQPICLPLRTYEERNNAKYNDMDDYSKDNQQPEFPEGFTSNEFLASPYHSKRKYRSSYMTWNNHGTSTLVKNKGPNCRTNSFSPDDAALKRCVPGGCLASKGKNPSWNNQDCTNIFAANGLLSKVNPEVSRIVLDNPDGSKVYCYPYDYRRNTSTDHWDDYSYNWCFVQGQNGPSTEWGWCNENCDRVPLIQLPEIISQEVHVDSFYQWGCGNAESTEEFCTGVKLNHPAQKIVTKVSDGNYITLEEETEAYNIQLIDQIKEAHYDPVKTGISNNTLWQHTEPCYGGRGASIWKIHRFHDNKEFFLPTDNRRTNGYDFAVLTGLMSRLPSECINHTLLDDAQVRWGPNYHATHTRVVNYIDWILTATKIGQESSCGKTHVEVDIESHILKKTTTSRPTTSTATTQLTANKTGSWWETRSSWVCQELTTRKLIYTMVPTCIISLDITTPKFNRTVCEWIWVSIIGVTPIPVMTCIPLTTCILLDHENSTDIQTPSVETECVNITSMVTRRSTFPNNGTRVITVTTCIYLEPNITCYPTTCVPVTNNTGRTSPTTFTTPWTTHPTSDGRREPPIPPGNTRNQGKRKKRSESVNTDDMDLKDTDNVS